MWFFMPSQLATVVFWKEILPLSTIFRKYLFIQSLAPCHYNAFMFPQVSPKPQLHITQAAVNAIRHTDNVMKLLAHFSIYNCVNL